MIMLTGGLRTGRLVQLPRDGLLYGAHALHVLLPSYLLSGCERCFADFEWSLLTP